MDATIVIATVLVLLIAIIIFLFTYSVRAGEQRAQEKLNLIIKEFENRHNSKVETKDFFRSSVISVNKDKTHLLYAEVHEEKGLRSTTIPLSEVVTASIWYRSLAKGLEKSHTNSWDLQEVILRVVFNDDKLFDIAFYSEVKDGPSLRNPQIELARKWEKLINSTK